MTVKSADGYTATYLLSAETIVRKKADKATVADLKTGDLALMYAEALQKVGVGGHGLAGV